MLETAASERIGGVINNKEVADTKPISLSHMSNTGNAQIFSCPS